MGPIWGWPVLVLSCSKAEACQLQLIQADSEDRCALGLSGLHSKTSAFHVTPPFWNLVCEHLVSWSHVLVPALP